MDLTLDWSINVRDVEVKYDPLRVEFHCAMNLHRLQPPSDSDGELYNQRVGKEILRQVVAQLREE